jgi:glycosyltransferase involved in cell wall biosynthesis
MRSRGLEIHVITTPGSSLDRFANEEMVEAHRLQMERKITPLRDFVTVIRLVRLFRRIRPDIVHASTPKGGLLGVISARLAGVPLVVYQVRGLAFTGLKGLGRTLLTTTEKIACKGAHQVLAVSPSLRAELLANGITSAKKVTVLGSGSSNGVAAETRFNPARVNPGDANRVRTESNIPKDAQVIGFVGRLVRDKGVMELATAWDQIEQEFPKAFLFIVGGWEERDAVPHAVRSKLEKHPRVRFAGEKSDVAPFYSVMDLVVLPTYREGFPNVPLEAAAMELPVVTTTVTGAVDAVVDGVTGTLIPPGDAPALASAMRKYLKDPGLRTTHGKAGRARVLRDFQPARIWEATFSAYMTWLAERGRAHPVAAS